MSTYTPRELALHAARLCLDKGALELRVMALPPGTALFDYVVLSSARSDRQTHAIVDEVHKFCKRHKLGHHPVEGESGWMLVDCLDVVVHCLSVEQRARYQIDSLWKAARDVDYEAELKKLPNPDQVLTGGSKS
ncbi:MAG: ribosome silencing factor [Planctomycetes bacterium]|nr:ribosome silencing factor [Planctomycetota bacterium]